MRAPATVLSVILLSCGSDPASTESACDKLSLQADNTELWYDGGRILAPGVTSATVTSQSTTITASATRQSTGFGSVITAYTVTINGETCRWP